jgi:hypothetical protein
MIVAKPLSQVVHRVPAKPSRFIGAPLLGQRDAQVGLAGQRVRVHRAALFEKPVQGLALKLLRLAVPPKVGERVGDVDRATNGERVPLAKVIPQLPQGLVTEVDGPSEIADAAQVTA